MHLAVLAVLAIMVFLAVMWGKEYSKRTEAEDEIVTYQEIIEEQRASHDKLVTQIEEATQNEVVVGLTEALERKAWRDKENVTTETQEE